MNRTISVKERPYVQTIYCRNCGRLMNAMPRNDCENGKHIEKYHRIKIKLDRELG